MPTHIKKRVFHTYWLLHHILKVGQIKVLGPDLMIALTVTLAVLVEKFLVLVS